MAPVGAHSSSLQVDSQVGWLGHHAIVIVVQTVLYSVMFTRLHNKRANNNEPNII